MSKQDIKHVVNSLLDRIPDIRSICLDPNSQTCRYTVHFNELPQIKLVITQSFTPVDGLKSNEVIFSVFEDKELILMDRQDIDQLIDGFSKYQKSKP